MVGVVVVLLLPPPPPPPLSIFVSSTQNAIFMPSGLHGKPPSDLFPCAGGAATVCVSSRREPLITPRSDLDPTPTHEDLRIGSPVVIVQAPPLLKTAEPMPMMRPNTGLIKPGDAGRIITRKPKDVWAVRFAAGAFLIDRKYFKPMKGS